MATTLANYRTKVSAKLGLDNSGSNPGSLTSDQTLMHFWANEGYQKVLALTKCFVSSSTIALSANATDVTLSSTYLAVLELFAPTSDAASAYRRMRRISAAELLEYRLAVGATADMPKVYSIQGTNMLMVYPSPASAVNLTIYYVAQPSALSADNDTASSIPPEWQKLVETYMLWQGAEYVQYQYVQKEKPFDLQFEEGIVDFKEAIRNYGGRVLSPTPIGRRRRPVYQPGQDDGR